MAVDTFVSVEEYLRSSYDPDRDYVDGRLLERNVGELDHSDLQTEIAVYFRNRKAELDVHAFVEQRVQISPTRFRIPDVCLVRGPKPTEPILRTPPFVAIEILSKDDRRADLLLRIDDYLKAGVDSVWVVDPKSRRGWTYDASGVSEPSDQVLRRSDPHIRLPLNHVFAAL